MSFSLFDLGLVLLLSTLLVRITFLSIPVYQFSKIFERKIREGSKLISALEIPGLKKFIWEEIILGFFSYFMIFLCLYFFNLDEYELSSISLFGKITTLLIFLFWVIIDWMRSIMIYRRLTGINRKTSKLKTIAGNIFDGLRFIVYIRSSPKKTALTLGTRALVGLSKKKLEEKQENEGKEPFGIVALSFLQRMITFPERLTTKLTDWAKENVDEHLSKEFEKYSKRSRLKLIILLFWSIIPSLWLLLLTRLSF